MTTALATDLALPAASVVIAGYSADRWAFLSAAVASVRAQTVQPVEIIVVIDHNDDLLARVRAALPGITALPNTRAQGASGARNTGVAVASGQVVAFLDDDAVAAPGWLAALLPHFADPAVVGVGGRLDPLWAGQRPAWFPPEFDWAVGASYRGMPESAAPVRNVWSGNMAIRRGVFEAVDGFREGFGKLGRRSRPEDTDLCLRAAAAVPGGSWIYEPAGLAGHRVPRQRSSVGFFLTRCYAEGDGKAALAALNGPTESTRSERHYARHVVPAGLATGLADVLRGRLAGAARSAAIMAGLGCAAAGYLAGRLRGTER